MIAKVVPHLLWCVLKNGTGAWRWVCVALMSSVLGLLASVAGTARGAEPAIDGLRINQIQFIGTHNSYHVRGATNRVREWNYSHAPLDVQLDRGVRSFELDLHYKQGEFEVFHVPLLDQGSTCPRLNDAAGHRAQMVGRASWPSADFLFVRIQEGGSGARPPDSACRCRGAGPA